MAFIGWECGWVCKASPCSRLHFCRYDWTLVSKVAEDFPLQQVIGGSMGCEHVDVFSSLLLKDMRHILTKILLLLGDMDLIR